MKRIDCKGPDPRRLDRSQAAKIQPRDDRGRFKAYDEMVVVDEIGNSGPLSSGERYFGYAVSITEDPRGFGQISREHMKKQLARKALPHTIEERVRESGELKARDDTEAGRREVLREIQGKGTRQFGYYVDKENPPRGWDQAGGGKNMTSSLEYTMDHIVPELNGDVMVVVDYHNVYKHQKVQKMLDSKTVKDGSIRGGSYNSAAGPYSGQLQTHDYVAYQFGKCLKSSDRQAFSGTQIEVEPIRSLAGYKRKKRPGVGGNGLTRFRSFPSDSAVGGNGLTGLRSDACVVSVEWCSPLLRVLPLIDDFWSIYYILIETGMQVSIDVIYIVTF